MHRPALALAIACIAAGCSDSPTAEPGPDSDQITVDAAADWAFLRLDEPARLVTVGAGGAASSNDWDIAFFGTGVMLNGGAAGPAGVVGYCICQNQGATDAQLLAMTPASQRAAFAAVTAADIPADEGAWSSDALAPAITGWYSYSMATHQITANPARVWKVRAAESTSPAYAKFHVTGIEGATRSSAGRVTIEYAVQSEAAAAMGATRTAVLDATSERVYFDFARGEVSDANDWDISIEGFTIRVNGGVSGSGRAGAVLASESFDEMTSASDAPQQVYAADAFGGVFDDNRWYRYNLTGAHDITPTFDVYLIRRGAAVWKVQLTGYYSVSGASRHVTLRYERIA